MFLDLGHTKLEAYTVARQFVVESYKATSHFPAEERYVLTQQIRRAALSVHLNTAEGSSRRSEVERKRYYEIARGSVIEVDGALDVASDLGYCSKEDLKSLGETMVKCFKLLSGLIKSTTKE
jgi:four helix bundle protein